MRLIEIPPVRAPLAAGWAVRRTRELLELLPSSDRRIELPPRRLRARAGVPSGSEYLAGGATAAQELAAGLRRLQREPGALRSLLDFGCATGRVLPHVAGLAADARAVGCDVDGAAIEWASAHHPVQEWVLSSFEPPLPFADQEFEFIYSIAVFSHLGGAAADRWLAELSRVLAPGGAVLLSVHGPSAFDAFRAGRVRTSWCAPEVFAREPLRAEDFVFAPYSRSTWTIGDLPGIGREYGLAFHGPDHIRQAWGRRLRVIEILPRAVAGWQDLVLCVRP